MSVEAGARVEIQAVAEIAPKVEMQSQTEAIEEVLVLQPKVSEDSVVDVPSISVQKNVMPTSPAARVIPRRREKESAGVDPDEKRWPRKPFGQALAHNH